jgi:hypothetical protein
LMDAAATRVGASVPLELRMKEQQKRKREEAEAKKLKAGKKTTIGQPSTIPLVFLNNNIGRMDLDIEMDRLRQQDLENNEESGDEGMEDQPTDIVLLGETEEMPQLWAEETRKTAFQAQYSKEMVRQVEILQLESDTNVFSSPPKMSGDGEDRSIAWEDGDA